MEKITLIVVLGGQISEKELREHIKIRADAAIMAWDKGITKRFIVSGGYNTGVRYDKKNIIPTNFSFEAFSRARREGPSEAQAISEYMRKRGVNPNAMFLEETSSHTGEQVEIIITLLKRSTFDFMRNGNGTGTVGILTQLYHMPKVMKAFNEYPLEHDLEFVPVFAEDFFTPEKSLIDRICEYYSVPKGKKQWPVDKIRELLSNGRSVGELLLTHK